MDYLGKLGMLKKMKNYLMKMEINWREHIKKKNLN